MLNLTEERLVTCKQLFMRFNSQIFFFLRKVFKFSSQHVSGAQLANYTGTHSLFLKSSYLCTPDSNPKDTMFNSLPLINCNSNFTSNFHLHARIYYQKLQGLLRLFDFHWLRWKTSLPLMGPR